MVKDMEKFISLCEICQTTKQTSQWMPGLLHQLPIPDAPWTSIVMDFIGPFPKSLDSNYLWVIVCCLTSQVHLVPIKTTTNTLEFAYDFLKNVVHLHGLHFLGNHMQIPRSEEHTSELQSLRHLVCRLLLEKKTRNAMRVARGPRHAAGTASAGAPQPPPPGRDVSCQVGGSCPNTELEAPTSPAGSSSIY